MFLKRLVHACFGAFRRFFKLGEIRNSKECIFELRMKNVASFLSEMLMPVNPDLNLNPVQGPSSEVIKCQ